MLKYLLHSKSCLELGCQSNALFLETGKEIPRDWGRFFFLRKALLHEILFVQVNNENSQCITITCKLKQLFTFIGTMIMGLCWCFLLLMPVVTQYSCGMAHRHSHSANKRLYILIKIYSSPL